MKTNYSFKHYYAHILKYIQCAKYAHLNTKWTIRCLSYQYVWVNPKLRMKREYILPF